MAKESWLRRIGMNQAISAQAMGGKFNPFQSKKDEVIRTHAVPNRADAEKLFEKLQRKRPYVWAEIQDLTGPAAAHTLDGLSGESSVALYVDSDEDPCALAKLPSALDELVTRLWKNFNKLHIIWKARADQG